MVQATVWKKAIPHVPDEAASPTTSEHRMPLGGVRAMTMEELVRYSVKEPPSDELGSRLVNMYLQQIHPRYPLLNPAEIWRLQKESTPIATPTGGNLSMTQRYGIFKLYMVFAIGATLLQLTNKSAEVSPERFYMTALQHMAAAKEPRTIQNIEAMTLLVVYHLRTASGLGLWYMIGLAMRTCIDLGMHRKNHEQGLSPAAIQAHRRLFWTVYSLERVIAISLGRPLSIAERQIDVELPDATPPASSPACPGHPYHDDLQLANLLFRLRRIEARIHHSIYRTDKPLSALRPKMERIYGELEAWRLSLTESLLPDSYALDYPLLLYHRAVRMLIQPFLTILPVSDPYYALCLSAAGSICQMHKRLHQTLGYGHSFIAVQTVFVAGVTLLYGLWTQTHLVWSVTLADDLRACSLVLFVMGERAPWVRKYRDAFEVLVDAAMEKLRSGESSLADMVAVAQSQAQARGGGGPERASQPAVDHATMEGPVLGGGRGSDGNWADGGEGGDVWRLVNELANWIDQDQETTPVWMPDFEALQNLSANEPH
ncbi:C6 transcription factor [Pleurostoma richardsiae]|uniref:C6 transcription factor n=1 Tax=Pleurostoma richardsiae TaxID=41990 RepID=A0AA38RXG8_9PEZI|nr:C6 transcription factor [Pleurostoma richardsiae]